MNLFPSDIVYIICDFFVPRGSPTTTSRDNLQKSVEQILIFSSTCRAYREAIVQDSNIWSTLVTLYSPIPAMKKTTTTLEEFAAERKRRWVPCFSEKQIVPASTRMSWFAKAQSAVVGLFKKKEHRAMIIGLDFAGKTTLLYYMKDYQPNFPTIGFSVETVVYKDFNVVVWDIGGQEKIRPLWRHYYQNTDALVFVIDATETDVARWEMIRYEIGVLMKEESLPHTVPWLFLINKMDLWNAVSPEAIMSSPYMQDALHPDIVWGAFPHTSMKGMRQTLNTVDKAFEWLGQSLH
eukprot:PhF_6_TR13519/c0_g1_i1/m.21603/K07937/ARF1; ADP-ribosylation factor 1